jgi:hypothetical protein
MLIENVRYAYASLGIPHRSKASISIIEENLYREIVFPKG